MLPPSLTSNKETHRRQVTGSAATPSWILYTQRNTWMKRNKASSPNQTGGEQTVNKYFSSARRDELQAANRSDFTNSRFSSLVIGTCNYRVIQINHGGTRWRKVQVFKSLHSLPAEWKITENESAVPTSICGCEGGQSLSFNLLKLSTGRDLWGGTNLHACGCITQPY